VSRLEDVRDRLPLPPSAALAEMRRGKRPISPPVFLAGGLQRAIVETDDSASEIGCEIRKSRRDAMWNKLTVIEIKNIESALESMTAAAERRKKEKG